ncbi:hypothetical protein Rhopal_006297-T1 [Rhodotorula paludigena]|uniref:Peptide hydrolase n=1 Tax=Rhodotorula paludigena TaxID=86838 RepID=A0AAV5GTL1_9BASI|nr:hypothetical protein Rhopal_006297-T1 [Rhodotorula paludigena]
MMHAPGGVGGSGASTVVRENEALGEDEEDEIPQGKGRRRTSAKRGRADGGVPSSKRRVSSRNDDHDGAGCVGGAGGGGSGQVASGRYLASDGRRLSSRIRGREGEASEGGTAQRSRKTGASEEAKETLTVALGKMDDENLVCKFDTSPELAHEGEIYTALAGSDLAPTFRGLYRSSHRGELGLLTALGGTAPRFFSDLTFEQRLQLFDKLTRLHTEFRNVHDDFAPRNTVVDEAGELPFSLSSSPSAPTSALASHAPDLATRLESLPVEHRTQLDAHLADLPQRRTVCTAADECFDISEGEKALLSLVGKRFVDVTDHAPGILSSAVGKDDYPSTIRYNATSLEPLFKHISIPFMTEFLGNLSNFFNRYYRSEYGVQSQQFLLSHLKELHDAINPSANVSFHEFKHSTWDQRTIILRWSPSSRSAAAAGPVLMTAHQDSTNSLPFLRAPGADDDGSGTTALVALFRALLLARWAPLERPLELMWFSAEEGGLLGSGEVARKYREEGREIKGMYHMDVVGYVKPSTTPSIGLITDGVSPSLTAYLARLIPHFSRLPVAQTQCGYGCSDHASWDKNGFRAACLSEGKFADSSPYMHSTRDVMTDPAFSFEHIAEFVKVGLGFALELAGWDEPSKE